MRLLRFNGSDIDIDDDTAIGITLQSYDIKEPGKRKISISNNFTLPKTANNLNILGYDDKAQFTTTTIYDIITCDYWVDNLILIDSARVRVESIKDRINVFVFQKEDIWDNLKKLIWPDFVVEFLAYLQSEESYPDFSNPFLGNIGEFVNAYKANTEGLILPFWLGNLFEYDPTGSGTNLETIDTIWLKYWPDTETNPAHGGHFGVFIKTIFEFIEWKYSVNFLTSGGVLDGNIWDDAIAPALYTPIRDIEVRFSYTGGGALQGFYFDIISSGGFEPNSDVQDKSGKTLYDLVNSFFQKFNIVKDEFIVNGEKVIRLARFDDINDDSDFVDFSGNISGQPEFIPKIEGFNQESFIKHSDIYPEGDEYIDSRKIVCENKNLDASIDLFTIDNYIPSFIAITNGVAANLSPKESFKTFSFFVNDGLTDDVININISDNTATTQTATSTLQKAALYSLDSEYQLIDSVVEYPVFYKIQKWLTSLDIYNFEFWKQRYIQELNGTYFVNKIDGFNPDKSLQPTNLEVFKISNKAIVPQKELEFYTDGFDNEFTDGIADSYF